MNDHPQSCVTCRHFKAMSPAHELGFCQAPLPEWLYRGPSLDRASNSVRVFDGKECGAYQPKEETE